MLERLLLPVDPARLHAVGFWLSWHARLMVLAWGLCAPLGIIFARFFKIWPGQDWPRRLDDQTWWILHRRLQYATCALTLIALALILRDPRAHFPRGLHGWLGWGVVALAALQLAGAALRGRKGGPTDRAPGGSPRGDHYDMTRRRRIFEAGHKATGRVAVLGSIAAILTGLWQANAPLWMWLALTGWWIALAITCGVLQSRGWVIPTYQAIWGPDPRHPGNAPRARPQQGGNAPRARPQGGRGPE